MNLCYNIAMKMQKNIMSIFSIVVFIGFVGMLVLSYVKYIYVKDEYYTKNEYIAQLVNSSMESILNQYDMTLEVLAEQLLKDSSYTDKQKTQKLLDKLLQKNPSLLGFGLADLNGDFLAVSSNIDIHKIKNLKENRLSDNSFEETLKCKTIVVGRTYYVKGLNKWVIPLRKTIYDKEGKAIAVMTTGLDLESAGGAFKNLKLKEGTKIVVSKKYGSDRNIYRIYYSGNDIKDKKLLYNRPISRDIIEATLRELADKYHMSRADFNTKGAVVTLESGAKDISGTHVFLSLIYNQKYKLWVGITSPSRNWELPLAQTITLYFATFYLLSMLLYFLFRRIYKSEEAKKAALHFQATHDALTGLPNRVYLQNNMLQILRNCDNEFTVLFIDLDNFKNINDKFGHRIGDKLLQNVAQRFVHYFGEQRLVVRQGGDEFIIITTLMDEKQKEEILKGMIQTLAQAYEIDGLEFNISASVGTADYPKDSTDIEELFSLADMAMYEAKKSKNTYASFSESLRERIFDKITMENELRSALERNEFWMVYQPQINADGSLHGVEALIRWKNEKLGMVSPEKFIKAAEEIGIIEDIGDFVIQRSLKEIRAIKELLGINFYLSINISVEQLIKEGFLDKIIDFIECARCKKNDVTLEITETTFIEDVERVLPILQTIRDHGMGLSMDDFGTGYSSLSVLKRLPIDELKIDKSFVDTVLTDKKSEALVKNVIKMGNELAMDTLAEGTETYEQVAILKEFGCKIFQGYYFSKPLKQEELIAFIKEQETNKAAE